jgi:hypothetical protein
MSPKVLLYDVECAPVVAHVWGLRDLNVGINQVVADPYVLGVGHKWYGGAPARYLSVNKLGRQTMLERTWALFDEADVVVGYNHIGFDNKWMNGEFAREGLTPPSPYKNIDLLKVARANFRFPSFKLQYVSTALGLEGKLSTGGHDLWIRTMAGDPAADRKMARYCKQDVELLEPLLDKLRPWVGNAVNFALWSEQGAELACQKCGASEFLRPKGMAYTATRAYKQWWCKPTAGGCGGWTREARMDADFPAAKGTGATR